MTMRFSDKQMIRLGEAIILLGIIFIIIPAGGLTSLLGLVLVGLGCAPIYPCIIHSIPGLFGADKSQAIIGVQMASAYTGICIMPPLFGLIANHISVALYPVYLLLILAAMWFMYEKLLKKAASRI